MEFNLAFFQEQETQSFQWTCFPEQSPGDRCGVFALRLNIQMVPSGVKGDDTHAHSVSAWCVNSKCFV